MLSKTYLLLRCGQIYVLAAQAARRTRPQHLQYPHITKSPTTPA